MSGFFRNETLHYVYVNVNLAAVPAIGPATSMNKTKEYSISDLSRHFDLTPRTIRFYEAEGLLKPARKNNKRVYRERDMVRLKLILRGKRLGFSLAEIKTTMDLYDKEPNETAQLHFVLETIESHRQELEQKQQDIVNTLDEMEVVADRIREKLANLETQESKTARA